MSCDGRCCAVFPVGGKTYAELERDYPRITDGATIFDMVRPLTREQARERALQFVGGEPSPDSEQLYRCVRWDETTRRCTRYAERPEMCSAYPYEHACDHGCGHEEPLALRWRWAIYRLRSRVWAWDGRAWQPSLTAHTLPG